MKQVISFIVAFAIYFWFSMQSTVYACTQTSPITSSSFYKSQLNNKEQEIYDKILVKINNKSTKISIPAISTSSIKSIYEAIELDNPELYYIPKGFKIDKSNPDKYVVLISYQNLKSNEFKIKLDKTLEKFYSLSTEYEKAEAIHDFIVNNCEYSGENTGIYGMIELGIGNCEGYSELFKYMCNKLGIESIVVTGKSREELHQWNMIRLDNEWYHVDVTWDDPIDGFPIYDYFCLSENQILNTHKISTKAVMPESKMLNHNYFVKNGLIVTSKDELSKAFKLALNKNQNYLSIKADNEEIYEWMLNTVDEWLPSEIKANELTPLSAYYMEDDVQLTINIELK